MKLLVTGAAGMLGHALVGQLQSCHEVVGVDIQEADLRDAAAARQLLEAHKPEVAIHAAAYTNVDDCETNPSLAWGVNAHATLHVAQACRAVGATMVYISTDYVFDGSKKDPYSEDDAPNPINVYGQTKLRGEQHVQETLDRYLILRTSWLYGPHGKNFVDTIRRLSLERNELRVVDDQRGSPTYTAHMAAAISKLVEKQQYGLMHLTGSGQCTWFEFSQHIVHLCGRDHVRVSPISSAEAGRPAKRPTNSVLKNARFAQAGFSPLASWQDALTEYLQAVNTSKA